MSDQQNRGDQDAGKGAVEGDGRARTEDGQNGNTSLSGQNPHRTESRLVKSNDSDLPEPGGSPEHSGQKVASSPADQDREPRDPEGTDVKVGHSPNREIVNQDPGERQKENQNQDKDDPLAA
jgi:hypothetical protein